jgi:hypothetical protein
MTHQWGKFSKGIGVLKSILKDILLITRHKQDL